MTIIKSLKNTGHTENYWMLFNIKIFYFVMVTGKQK